MKSVEKIKLKSVTDERGVLSVIEFKDYFDWEAKRVYYVTDVTLPRGAHAVRGEKKVYICQKGRLKAKLHDGKEWHEFEMTGPGDAILMNSFCYREFFDFTEDAVLMAISSVNYNPDDYIYDFDEFLKEAK